MKLGKVSNQGPESQTILEAAKKFAAEVIVTPGPLCRQNVEMYQDAVNKKYGTDYQIPVVFHSQVMTVTFSMDAKKDACLDRNTIRSEKLEKIAKKG